MNNLPIQNTKPYTPTHSYSTTGPSLSKHRKRIREELKALGVTDYGLWKLSSRYLFHVIHANEEIGGIVYGHSLTGSSMLIATDQRVVFLDKKPFFFNEDEVRYDLVGGVSFSHVGAASTVTLHTRIQDYTIKTFNNKCAQGFVDYIETKVLEHKHEDWIRE